MEPHPKPKSDGVSRVMLVVIVAMLLVILVPVTVVSLPLSHIKVTIINTSSEGTATCYISIFGLNADSRQIVLSPGQEKTSTFSAAMGYYEVSIHYSWGGGYYYGDSYYQSIDVGWVDTAEVEFELYDYHSGNTTSLPAGVL